MRITGQSRHVLTDENPARQEQKKSGYGLEVPSMRHYPFALSPVLPHVGFFKKRVGVAH